jgi:hypothetical protein
MARAPRATINLKRERKLPVVHVRHKVPQWRPRTRADCEGIPRPCPFISCRHNLYIDVKENGNIRLNFPHIPIDEVEHSCVLDLAEKGGMTLAEVGDVLAITREMVRQMELKIWGKLSSSGALDVLHSAWEGAV